MSFVAAGHGDLTQALHHPERGLLRLTTEHAAGLQLTRIQHDGVAHMLRKFRDRNPTLKGMVRADVMDLGKSAQAIVMAAELGGRVLVVEPTNHVPSGPR